MHRQEALQPELIEVPRRGASDGSGAQAEPPQTHDGRAIEQDFPFETVSDVAELESWRKEVHRPIYHVHKWWAQRLGSVFRSAIIAAAVPKGLPVMDLFYASTHLRGLTVFDPFMGSGTTIGEALKLGCATIGRDINPVAHRAVRVALSSVDRAELDAQFKHLEASAGRRIQEMYQAVDSAGQPCSVLYYFWVMVLPCECCSRPVDLFSSYIFASHASKATHPEAKAICPACGGIVACRHNTTNATCRCGETFNPQSGPARRTNAVCTHCGHKTPIARTFSSAGQPPEHRLIAKLVLRADGTKEYLPIEDRDLLAYRTAERRLAEIAPPLPTTSIKDGHNTKQVLNYGYRSWHQLFNVRQLLALTTLASAIQELPPSGAKDALAVLFSGTLEFNNMFASYKGEGTGAVRHLFSHHILKPERMPIEANPWGTSKSSGAFSTLYRSRLLRALDYRDAPFEIAVRSERGKRSGRKIYGASAPIRPRVLDGYPATGLVSGDALLSCGDSASTDLPEQCVDLVVTDPPFFDNVHYSELADFFYAWQRLYFPNEDTSRENTRRPEEVQDADAPAFGTKLKAVFAECRRVLRDEGLMVFSYHHSKDSGWLAVADAVHGAGFAVVQSHPVKAELSVATPKKQAKQPINLDVLITCKKTELDRRSRRTCEAALSAAEATSHTCIRRFNAAGRRLSLNDVRVVLSSLLLVEISAARSADEVHQALQSLFPQANRLAEGAWRSQDVRDKGMWSTPPGSQRALPLDAIAPR